MRCFITKHLSNILRAACVLVWICSAIIMWRGNIDRFFVIAITNFISCSLVGIRGRITPSEENLYQVRDYHRRKNKTYISDEEYILRCKRTATWFLIIGGIWGIYIAAMLVIRIIY